MFSTVHQWFVPTGDGAGMQIKQEIETTTTTLLEETSSLHHPWFIDYEDTGDVNERFNHHKQNNNDNEVYNKAKNNEQSKPNGNSINLETTSLNHLQTLVTTDLFQLPDTCHDTFSNPMELSAAGFLSSRLINTYNGPWFQCKECNKSFRTKVTLSRHEKIHKGNAFQCPKCPKIFYQVSNIKYHVKAVHGVLYDDVFNDKKNT